MLGLSHYLAGHIAEAIPYLEEVRAAAPDDVSSPTRSAMAYAQTRQPDKARESIARTFQLSRRFRRRHLLTGQMMNRLELEDLAEAELKQALTKDPKLPEAHYLLGQIAIFRSRLDEGIALMRRGARDQPGARDGALLGSATSTRARRNGPRRSPRCSSRSGSIRTSAAPTSSSARRSARRASPRPPKTCCAAPSSTTRTTSPRTTCSRRSSSRPGRAEEAATRIRDRGTAAGRRSSDARAACAATAVPGVAHLCAVGRAGGSHALRRRRAGRCRSWTSRTAPGCAQPSIYGGLDRKRFIIETNGAGVAFFDYDNDGWTDALVLSGIRLRTGTRAIESFAPGSGAGVAPLSQQSRRHLHRRHRRAGLRRDRLGLVGVLRRRLRQRRLRSISSSPTTARTCCIAIAATARSRTSPRAPGLPAGGTRWGSGLRLPRLRPRRPRSICSSRTTCASISHGAPEVGQGPELPVEGRAGELRAARAADRHQPAVSQRRRRARSPTSRQQSGIATVTGRYPMTAAAADFDGDGWLDIYVACDSTASILYRNNHDGTFTRHGRRERRRLQRERHAAGRHGPRGRRLQRRRPARSPEDAFRRRCAGALPESRQGAVRGRRRRQPASAC